MDETDEEKVQLLESLRLQDAALLTTVDNSIVNLESESEDEETAPVSGDSEEPHVKSKETGGTLSREDDANEIEVIRNDPSWADALEANQEYDAMLAQFEAEIKLNLAKVLKQLDEVQKKISSVTNERTPINMKSHWLYVFGMPYFKSGNFYPCPYNKDYFKKKQNNEICWVDLPPFRQWMTRHKKILNSAVRKLSLEKCVNDAHFKLAVLRKELETAKQEGNSEKVAALKHEIEMFDINAVAQSMVDNVVENGEHDWLQISAKYLDGKQSAESCRSFWLMYLHPKINKASYTEEEENKLISIAEKYGQQDWDRIAEELGTNRSGYQCFIVYQNKLTVGLRRNPWNASEDRKLLEIVEKSRIGDYIPWGKVAYHMEGRTKTQVFNRWTYSVNPAIRKGRFTQEEDIMILAGVQLWGEDFHRISNFLRDRTTCQVRDRYKNYLNRPGLGVPWTIEDDELLLKLTAQYGKNWAKIQQHFPSKNRTQVRHRYSTITKWRVKNPSAPLCDAPSRCYNPQQYKDFQEQWDKARAILNCGTVEEMVKAKNTLISSIIKKKRAVHDPVKKKKESLIELDLINYFRCSYNMPGGWRKMQLKSGEAQKYASELSVLLPLLKANLKLPSYEEIEMDSSLSTAERDILKAYLSQTESMESSPSHSSEAGFLDAEDGPHHHAEMDALPAPLFCDVKPFLEVDDTTDIDYIPTRDLTSLYIKLPLMNFDQDEVVADRNQDPSFFEPPALNYYVPEDVVPDQGIREKESYLLPPNLTSLVGLRTFLLNRRNLLTWSNEKACEEVLYDDEKLPKAKEKFDERLMCLFLWPALMSRYGPSSHNSIFLEEGDEIPEADSQPDDFENSQNFMPMAKESLSAKHGGIPSTSRSPADSSSSGPSENPNTSVNPKTCKSSAPLQATTSSGTSKSSLPPKKRRKVTGKKEDSKDSEDPDDPDFLVNSNDPIIM